jgi:hypothetical protein
MSVTVAEVVAVADALADGGQPPLGERSQDALAAAAKLARHDLRCGRYAPTLAHAHAHAHAHARACD